MIPSQSVSDEDKYVPAGLLNSAENALEINTIKEGEICEFYNLNKAAQLGADKSSKESNVIADLSKEIKTEIITPASTQPVMPKSSQTPRVLTLQPGSNHPILPTDAPRPIPPSPKPYIPRTVRVQPLPQYMYHQMPGPLNVPAVLPYNLAMLHPPRPIPYHPPPQMPIKSAAPNIASQAIMNASMYGYPYIQPMHPSMNHMNLMSPINPMYHPGIMMMSHAVPFNHPANAIPILKPPHAKPLEQIMPPPEPKLKISPETRKKLKEEAAAKLKAERDAQKALLKAQKLIEKAKKAVIKKKKDTAMGESGSRKFGNFSKDMFVIRLKDVDSFNRNNEIWRIDNHVLIQKFCGVPSLRAPARQFQSTNRMSGYDHRATWRLFIINPDNVEIEKYGSEVTIHDFPTISVLREAKQLAEMKDGAFKEIEKSEYKEKMHALEAKQRKKIQAKLQKRLERKQKKLMKKMKFESSGSKHSPDLDNTPLAHEDDYDFHYEDLMTNDERVCRDVLNGLLNALDDENYDDGGLFSDEGSDLSDEEEDDEGSDYTEEDEDAGSLISMTNFSDECEDDLLNDKPQFFPVYGEDELPAVELEVVID